MSRSSRWILAAALVAAPCLAASVSRTAVADPATAVTAGAVRAVFAKDGTPLRSTAMPLARPVQVLPYGARVTVLEVRRDWARVRTMSGQQAEGWVLKSQTVAPYALSGDGRLGRSGADNSVARPVGGLATEEQAAVSRGLGPEQETLHKQQRQDLASSYAALDALQNDTPTPTQIESFVQEGGLSRPAPAR